MRIFKISPPYTTLSQRDTYEHENLVTANPDFRSDEVRNSTKKNKIKLYIMATSYIEKKKSEQIIPSQQNEMKLSKHLNLEYLKKVHDRNS